jgi:hypothetical protein
LIVTADSWFQADVAQLVEHSLGKGEVTSSILVIGSRVWKCKVEGFVKGHGFSRVIGLGMESGFSRWG